jgi:hypothetical protein
MRIQGLVIAAVVGLSLVAGCAEILNTHSSGDGPAGEGPIPGLPTGDSVDATGEVLFNGGNFQLVSQDASLTRVRLIPTGQTTDYDDYLLNFSGVMTMITPLPFIAVDAIDTGARIACGIEIGGGEFRLVGGAGTAVVGTYSANADQHNILLRVSRENRLCYLNIRQFPQGAGTGVPQTQAAINASGSFVDNGFTRLAEMRVQWEQPSRRNPKSYFLGPVTISARN